MKIFFMTLSRLELSWQIRKYGADMMKENTWEKELKYLAFRVAVRGFAIATDLLAQRIVIGSHSYCRFHLQTPVSSGLVLDRAYK